MYESREDYQQVTADHKKEHYPEQNLIFVSKCFILQDKHYTLYKHIHQSLTSE